jgi:hypothetical protein
MTNALGVDGRKAEGRSAGIPAAALVFVSLNLSKLQRGESYE